MAVWIQCQIDPNAFAFYDIQEMQIFPFPKKSDGTIDTVAVQSECTNMGNFMAKNARYPVPTRIFYHRIIKPDQKTSCRFCEESTIAEHFSAR